MALSFEERKERAYNRQLKYEKLSDQQKLLRALQRGHGDTKEVRKLRARIEQQNKAA